MRRVKQAERQKALSASVGCVKIEECALSARSPRELFSAPALFAGAFAAYVVFAASSAYACTGGCGSAPQKSSGSGHVAASPLRQASSVHASPSHRGSHGGGSRHSTVQPPFHPQINIVNSPTFPMYAPENIRRAHPSVANLAGTRNGKGLSQQHLAALRNVGIDTSTLHGAGGRSSMNGRGYQKNGYSGSRYLGGSTGFPAYISGHHGGGYGPVYHNSVINNQAASPSSTHMNVMDIPVGLGIRRSPTPEPVIYTLSRRHHVSKSVVSKGYDHPRGARVISKDEAYLGRDSRQHDVEYAGGARVIYVR
jgi:hypothetical protein